MQASTLAHVDQMIYSTETLIQLISTLKVDPQTCARVPMNAQWRDLLPRVPAGQCSLQQLV